MLIQTGVCYNIVTSTPQNREGHQQQGKSEKQSLPRGVYGNYIK